MIRNPFDEPVDSGPAIGTMANLDQLSVLVVEANQGMRAQLRAMLEGFQINGVQFAPTAGSAIRRLREQRFDLILCEFDLGESQDGQHLLEDLRSKSIIPPETLFIMITSERNYERVIGAAELSPDDYILKPLTAGTLQVRLERALNKREVFLPLYRAIAGGDPQQALDYCLSAESEYPRLRIDFMRKRAELLASMGQTDRAEAVFREILEIKSIPWARLGLGRMLFARKAFGEAAKLFEGLVAESSYYLDAYDWLARTRKESGLADQACAVLADAVELSPHRMSRLRQYASASMDTGDFAKAEQTMAEVVRKGKYSDFRDPQDHVHLVRTQLAQDRVAEAQKTIHDLEQSMPGMASSAVCSAFSKALVHQSTGNAEGARAEIRKALEIGKRARLETGLQHQLLDACLEARLDAEGSQLATEILRNAVDGATIDATRAVMKKRGRNDLAEAVEAQLHAEVKAYVANGAALAQAGDFDGAVKEMMSAVRKMPGNHHVLFNAALALLRHIEHKGWNERFADQARTLINRVRRLDPGNARLEAIINFSQALAKKYGIQPTRPVPPRAAPATEKTDRLAWVR